MTNQHDIKDQRLDRQARPPAGEVDRPRPVDFSAFCSLAKECAKTSTLNSRATEKSKNHREKTYVEAHLVT